MNQIMANPKKNYLIIQLEGYLNEDEVKDIVSRIMKAVQNLSPGFTVINDISKVNPASQSVLNEIRRVQGYVFHKGVKKVIRIVGNVMSQIQLKKTQQDAGADYEVIEVTSMEEALKFAD